MPKLIRKTHLNNWIKRTPVAPTSCDISVILARLSSRQRIWKCRDLFFFKDIDLVSAKNHVRFSKFFESFIKDVKLLNNHKLYIQRHQNHLYLVRSSKYILFDQIWFTCLSIDLDILICKRKWIQLDHSNFFPSLNPEKLDLIKFKLIELHIIRSMITMVWMYQPTYVCIVIHNFTKPHRCVQLKRVPTNTFEIQIQSGTTKKKY